jgi:catechol 2,3-dioxygenase-like lactoylglutathione lyase family enzyme
MRLDHIVIPVFDAEAALSFYADTLGLPLVDAFDGDDWGGFPWLMLTFALADGRHLVLVALRGAADPGRGAVPADARHYAFSVEPADLDAWRARLTAADVAFWEESHGPHASLYFPDPDGTILEITAPPTHTPHGPPDPEALARAKAWIAG